MWTKENIIRMKNIVSEAGTAKNLDSEIETTFTESYNNFSEGTSVHHEFPKYQSAPNILDKSKYILEDQVSLLNRYMAFMDKPKDECLIFGDHVATEMRSLPRDLMAMVKRKITLILLDATEEAERRFRPLKKEKYVQAKSVCDTMTSFVE